MGVWKISTWILILFDAIGAWLLLRPSDLMNLWTAHRAPASQADRFIARLVGVILLSAQLMYWVGQEKGTNSQVAVHWLSIVLGISAAVFLGYHLVCLFALSPDRRAQVQVAGRRLLLPESDEEAKARYRAAWRKYRKLRTAFAVLILGWLPLGVVLSAVFRLLQWDWHIPIITMLVCIPFVPIVGWQWSFWQCPRCGYAFKGTYDPFFPKRCHHCNLPMWAESPNQ
jgi:hypothetical protein